MWLEELEARPLEWIRLRAMLDEIGDVTEEPYGLVRVTRKGQTLVLRTPAKAASPSAAQVARIRQFVEKTQCAPSRAGRVGEWLVVIDRFEASVFRSLAAGAVPQLIRSPQANGEGGGRAPYVRQQDRVEASPPPGFFEPLVGVLHCAQRILIIGRETTLGGEAERFVRWLRGYRPAVAQRIVAFIAVEPHEFTEAGLVAKARKYYAQLDARGTSAVDDGPGGALTTG